MNTCDKTPERQIRIDVEPVACMCVCVRVRASGTSSQMHNLSVRPGYAWRVCTCRMWFLVLRLFGCCTHACFSPCSVMRRTCVWTVRMCVCVCRERPFAHCLPFSSTLPLEVLGAGNLGCVCVFIFTCIWTL